MQVLYSGCAAAEGVDFAAPPGSTYLAQTALLVDLRLRLAKPDQNVGATKIHLSKRYCCPYLAACYW